MPRRLPVGRVLYWLQPAIAAVALAFTLFYFAYLGTYSYSIHFGVGALGTAGVILPGLILSLGLNQWLLHRRRVPRTMSITEVVLVGAQGLLVLLLVWQAFDQWSLATVFVTPVLIALAIASTVLLRRRAGFGLVAAN
jgi:hypothetical protein